jgi:hypothetical protein
MNFTDYQQKSRTTAKYPVTGHGVVYPTLGLTMLCPVRIMPLMPICSIITFLGRAKREDVASAGRFGIIANDERRSLFVKQLSRPTFKLVD